MNYSYPNLSGSLYEYCAETHKIAWSDPITFTKTRQFLPEERQGPHKEEELERSETCRSKGTMLAIFDFS